MALQNFVDKQGPIVSASFLNGVDVLTNQIFQSALTNPAARAALCSDAPLEVFNGGTGATTPAAARVSLTIDAPLEIANGGTGQRNLTNFLASLFPQSNPSQAEITSGAVIVNPSYAVMNVIRYGADSSGSTPSDNAIATAIAVAKAQGGGDVIFPPGTYSVANTIMLDNCTGVQLNGNGGISSGLPTGSNIVYTSPGSNAIISLRSSSGCVLNQLDVRHSNPGFTGAYFDWRGLTPSTPSHQGRMENCSVGSNVGGAGCVHLLLNNSILFTAYRVMFFSGNPSVMGRQTGGFCNLVTFQDCAWENSVQAPVNTQGDSWSFIRCNFEVLVSGGAGGIAGASAGAGTQTIGMSVISCWFGDVGNNTTGGTWISGCFLGAIISGNEFEGFTNADGTVAINLQQSSGVAILGNSFQGLNTCINFAVANCIGIVCMGNTANNVTHDYLNSGPNVPLGQLTFARGFGFGIPAGHGALSNPGFRVNSDGSSTFWGNTSVTTGTPVAVTYNGAVGVTPATATLQVQLTFSTAAGTNTATYSAVSNTGFTISVIGTAGSNVVQWEAKCV